MAKEKDFEFTRGDTQGFSFTLEDEDLKPITKVDEIYFTLKESFYEEKALLQKRLSRKEIELKDNRFYFGLKHEDTGKLDYGKYAYDIQVVLGEYVKTVLIGQIELTKESTFITNE